MKRVLKALTALAIAHPTKAAFAGAAMLMGVGGVVISGQFTTPAIVPQPTAFINNGNEAAVNNGLQTPAGAFQVPSTTANSMGVFVEGSISPGLGPDNKAQFALGQGTTFVGLEISDNAFGLPTVYFQKNVGGVGWWNTQGFNLLGVGPAGGGTVTTYNPGYYPFTATGGLCPGAGAREPSGVFGTNNGGTSSVTQGGTTVISDPGFLLCSTPTISLANIPNLGAQQSTLATTACVNNSPWTGHFTVTAHVTLPHGITPGQTYTLQGLTPTGFNITYTALGPTSGTTLVGTATGACPAASATAEGTALGGVGGTITMPAIATIGATGIATHNGQKFCALITENGADSSFPGSQAVAMVDDHGNPLQGAPALVPNLNQGTANFNGTITFGSQPALNVTSMASYTVTAATWAAASGNVPAQVTFTTSTTPMFEPGSEFTVSGMTPSAYNGTYVAVGGTTTNGTVMTATPLSGPLGIPQALSNPGTATGFGSLVSVIMPGMRIYGGSLTNATGVISPFGTSGGTGTGGVGTYATTNTAASYAIGTTVPSSGILTASGLTLEQWTPGTTFSGSDGAGATTIQITGFGTGLGTSPNLNGTYQTNYTGGTGGTHSFTTTNVTGVGTISPALLFAAPPFYQSIIGVAGTGAGSLSPPSTSFTTVPVAQATIGDFATSIGTETTTTGNIPGSTGWSGTLANVADLWMPGGFPTQAGGAPSTSSLASLCKKQTDVQQFATTNGFTVHSLYRLNDLGIFADSSSAQFTGSIAGTALSIGSTQTGSASALAAGTVIAGAGITGCPSACPTVSSGSGSSYTLNASGGTVSSEPMTAGAFAPAIPTPTSAFDGWIDNAGSVPTLHVSTLANSSPNTIANFTGSLNVAFTAKIDNGSGSAGNILTVSAPAIGNAGGAVNPYIGVGTTITIPSGSPATDTVASLGTGLGANGTYIMTHSQTSVIASTTMHASGVMPGLATNLTVSGVTGTIASGMIVTDGGANLTGPPLLTVGAVTAGDVPIVPTYYPTFSADTTMTGTLSTLLPGQYILNSGITTPVKVITYQGACSMANAYYGGPGCYTLSNNSSNGVGGGSPILMTSTGVTDGAPVPTRALTIKDLGPNATLPVTNSTISCTGVGACTGTGSIPLSGTYDISVLGGTPTIIQAQVSQTAGGPPVPGCSACAWTALSSYSATPLTLTASITTGGVMTPSVVSAPTLGIGQAFTGAGYSGSVTGINVNGMIPTYTVTPSPGSAIGPETMTATNVFSWSGNIPNIPGSPGPLYVSVRASNGTAYAMLENPVRMGLAFEIEGEGHTGALFSANQGGNAVSYFTGGLGVSRNLSGGFFQGPPPIAGSLIPGKGLTILNAEDRFNINGLITPEGSTDFQQGVTTAFGGWPTNWVPILRDGIGIEPETLGNATQTQTVGVANGSLTTWCSSTTFCSNASITGQLLFNGASLSGGQITAKIDNGSGSAGNILTLGIGTRFASWFGAIEPGAVLTDTTGNITGAPALVNCLTGCAPITSTSPTIPYYCVGKCYPNIQTWAISGAAQLVSLENMRADVPQSGGTPWPVYSDQSGFPLFTTFGTDLIRAGTFKIMVNGTVVCQDTTVPMSPFNNQTGNCTDGSGHNLGWVNFQTGDYQFTPLSTLASGVITASWTHIVSTDVGQSAFERPGGYDFFGTPDAPGVGFVSSIYDKSPGGVSAHIFAGGAGVQSILLRQGYPYGVGYSQMVSWLYDTRFPTIPGVSANTPVLFGQGWGLQGPVLLTTFNDNIPTENNLLVQWFHDVSTKSTFLGTVTIAGGGATGLLTLTATTTTPMWEGEVIGCASFSLTCPLGSGTYIQSLASGAWGASGSTYNLATINTAATLISAIGSPISMTNAMYYTGPGGAANVGPFSDQNDQLLGIPVSFNGSSPHGGSGQQGVGRIGRRIAALAWGALSNNPANASAPFLDRVKADAIGCDPTATAAPCFDTGNAFATTATATNATTLTLTFNGLPAHTLPIADGEAVSCTGCNPGLVVVSVDHPPTQDTRAGQGQIGSLNNFIVTLNATSGVSGSGHIFTFGCSGAGGVGSNCIDIAYTIPTTGTYATAASLANCGENNANGNAPPFIYGNGNCQTNLVGSLVRNFAIGSNQALWDGTAVVTGHSYYDDGVEPGGVNGFNQSGAFTCNIASAKVVRCVLAPKRVNGLVTGIGQWPATGTYVEQGDSSSGNSRIQSLMGFVGGQSFPITSRGSGQTPGFYSNVAGVCTTIGSGGIIPIMDLTVGSGGTLINAYLSTATNSLGLSIETPCTFTVPGSAGGTAGSVTVSLDPFEGFGGIGTTNTDNNLKGVGVYDNTMLPGNPLSSFQSNCPTATGYCESGLAAEAFGLFLGAQVSGLSLTPLAAPTVAQGAAFNYGTDCSGGTASCLLTEDTFTSSSLNTSNWNPFMSDAIVGGRWNGGGCGLPSPYSSTGGGGNVISYGDPYNYGFGTAIDTVHMAGGSGVLSMTAALGSHFAGCTSNGYTWSGSVISSHAKTPMVCPTTGCFIQVRAQSPDRTYGAWPAIWMLGDGAGSGGAEFDISDGAVSALVGPNTHSASHWFGCNAHQTNWATPGGVDVTNGYHVYGMEYLPSTSFKVWFDGSLVANISLSGCTVTSNFELILSMMIASPATSSFYPQPDGVHNGPFVWNINDVQIYNHPLPLAPSNQSLPVISGTPQVGQTLAATNGTWVASPSPSFTYQWLKGGTPIAGATGTTYVPVTGDVGANISVSVTATNASGHATATSTTVGPVISSVPAFVAAVCPGLPSTGMCVDFVGNQAWDGTAQATVTPASLLTDTRSAAAPYDPGTAITTSIAANTLPLGSAGLQVFQNNVNYQTQSGGDYTATGWAKAHTVAALPTITKNAFFGTTGCTTADTAPDGSCNTTEMAFPAVTATGQQTAVQLLVSGLTANSTYTFSVWLKNSAATANPQTYLNVQEGTTPFLEIARTLAQPGATWQRYAVTFTVPTGFTSAFVEVGNCVTSSGTTCQQAQLGGGTLEAWVSEVTPGVTPGPYVPTTTSAATTIALDNIVPTGNLATALASSSAALSVTVKGSGNGVAGTIVDSNGTVLLGKSAADHVVTALGATLTSKALGNFSASENAYLSWSGSGGSIDVNGTPVVTDATARTPAGPFHVGTTSGTSAPLNGYITSLAVYPTATTPTIATSMPITGLSMGTIATISSGTLQGGAPSTFVNGDSWVPTEDASGNVWSFCNDCGWGGFAGFPSGNAVLTEATGWTNGTPGWLNLGSSPTELFTSNLGAFNTVQAGTENTWKSCGLVAVSDGANTDLFAGLTFDSYGVLASDWIQTTSMATVISNTAANAAVVADWNGLPPSPAVLPATTPTFSTEQFGSPCFIQYAPGYVNSTLPTPNPDNSNNYLYAISNDGGWNGGSNIYLSRIPLATIETSLGGSLSASATPSNYQFYNSAGCTGGDGMNSACWGSLASATPIFSLTNRLSRSSMTYLPGTNRYALLSWYYPTINGLTRTTQTSAQSSAITEWELIDCAKPWLCTGVVQTLDFNSSAYYNPAIVPPSLALDGGFTATSIFTGNFNGGKNFNSGAVYTPTMGQMTFRY